MRVAVNNTVIGTVRIKVCAAPGSSVCSGIVSVAVEPAPSTVPTVRSVSPDTISEGTGYQNVTISGTNFSSTNSYQFSTNSGNTWDWAQSAPTIVGSTSMKLAVNDTTPGTVLIRVCAAHGSSTCSGPVTLTIRPSAQSDLGAPCPPEGCSTNSDKAVVITHGWNADAFGWVHEMASAVCERLGSPQWVTEGYLPNKIIMVCSSGGWDVFIIDWSSWSYFILAGGPPQSSWAWAARIGPKVGSYFADLKQYRHLHIIGHSAGSKLVDSATTRLKEKDPSITVHATFLDPFDPFQFRWSEYGRSEDWADNYVDTRGWIDSPYWTFLSHKVFSIDAYNIDVTPSVLDEGGCSILSGDFRDVCAHSRPYRFYGIS
jgi:hypothetical protein